MTGMAKMLHKNVAQNVTKSCTKLLGTLRSNDVTATRTSLKKVYARSFSRYRDYFYLLTLPNVREPSRI